MQYYSFKAQFQTLTDSILTNNLIKIPFIEGLI